MNNHLNNNINNNTVTSNRRIASCYLNGVSQIPLPQKTYTSNLSLRPTQEIKTTIGTINNAERWKVKYEEAEKKRKALLTQSEKTNRELAELNKKYERIIEQNKIIVQQLTEKHDQLEKLKVASKDFYLEYDTLKNKYDVETGAYRKAIQQSSKWYRENNKLKRKSAVLVQRMLQINPGELIEDEFNDVVDNVDDETHAENDIDEMRKTITELSDTVARLQAELNSAKLMEFESTEQTVNLTQELETEREKRKALEAEVEKLVAANDHMSRVSKLVAVEVANLRDTQLRDRESAVILRNEADNARKERNVLAHQSALLMGEIMPAEGDDKLFRLLEEVENLKRALEDEKNQHAQEIAELQEKLDSREAEMQIEILEEKLKLAESELQAATERAENAEKELDTLKAPPIPPPPPPPPLLLTSSPTPASSIRLKTVLNLNSTPKKENPVEDMEKLLGIDQNTPKKQPYIPPAAIDSVINQIKGGRFTLKQTEKVEQKKPREEPAAVKEMLNVLGTLRRRQKATRPRIDNAFGDVQL
ncbi:shootin-1 [Chrysoperla carnea]|uniref:shootin-1 n=1 Tax=Chrysoperla carnea TaxID=189513 RepID=UPI001D06931D|nr:shootin-1 [Chrysoperla carnea]